MGRLGTRRKAWISKSRRAAAPGPDCNALSPLRQSIGTAIALKRNDALRAIDPAFDLIESSRPAQHRSRSGSAWRGRCDGTVPVPQPTSITRWPGRTAACPINRPVSGAKRWSSASWKSDPPLSRCRAPELDLIGVRRAGRTRIRGHGVAVTPLGPAARARYRGRPARAAPAPACARSSWCADRAAGTGRN